MLPRLLISLVTLRVKAIINLPSKKIPVSNFQESLITHISWGHIEVKSDDKTYRFKDCKVWSGCAKEWDWTLTGTRHRPGIQPTDIEEILAHDVDFMVLSRGIQLMLHICPETEDLLSSRNIEYYIGQTQLAVELFNSLMRQGRKVGGVFHSTC